MNEPVSPDDRRLPPSAAGAVEAAANVLRPDRSSASAASTTMPNAAFVRASELIAAGGHAIVDTDPRKGVIETTHAVYLAIEDGSKADYPGIRARLLDTIEQGKNFAVYAERLSDESVSHVRTQLDSRTLDEKGLRSVLVKNAAALRAAIAELETSTRRPSEANESQPMRVLRLVVGFAIFCTILAWLRDRGVETVPLACIAFAIWPLCLAVRSAPEGAAQLVAAASFLVGIVAIVAALVQAAAWWLPPVSRSLAAVRARILAVFRKPTAHA